MSHAHQSPGPIEKEWIAVYDDRVLVKANTQQKLESKIARTKVPTGYTLCAVPKAHQSVLL